VKEMLQQKIKRFNLEEQIKKERLKIANLEHQHEIMCDKINCLEKQQHALEPHTETQYRLYHLLCPVVEKISVHPSRILLEYDDDWRYDSPNGRIPLELLIQTSELDEHLYEILEKLTSNMFVDGSDVQVKYLFYSLELLQNEQCDHEKGVYECMIEIPYLHDFDDFDIQYIKQLFLVTTLIAFFNESIKDEHSEIRDQICQMLAVLISYNSTK
jgi:hypothetical protein